MRHRMKAFMTATIALVAVLNAGCMAFIEHGTFHGDRGDLVSSDGTVRYVGWCELHKQSASCRSPLPETAVALAAAQ